MKTSIIAIFILCLTGCSALTAPKEKPVIEDKLGIGKDIGTLAITAERRVILVKSNSDGSGGTFCAEPSPDIAESITSSLRAAAEASIKNPGNDEKRAGFNVAKDLSTSLSTLFVRSQGIQYMRDALYSLCQAKMNKVVSDQPDKYLEIFGIILENSRKLIAEELVRTNEKNLAEAVIKAQNASVEAQKAAAVGEAAAKAARDDREKAEQAAEAVKKAKS